MTPDSVHLIAQEIRHYRSLLTSLRKWNVAQPHSQARVELFHRIDFWREILNEAERRIATPQSSSSFVSPVQCQGQG